MNINNQPDIEIASRSFIAMTCLHESVMSM